MCQTHEVSFVQFHSVFVALFRALCRLFCMSYYTCLSSQYGDSALMRAASWGRTEVVVELIKAGANLNLQNKVQRLSILCMCTTHIQHMMYMNRIALCRLPNMNRIALIFCGSLILQILRILRYYFSENFDALKLVNARRMDGSSAVLQECG